MKLICSDREESSRKVRFNFKKRKTTLKKKASQLSKLCDVDVGMVCFGPDRMVETWPENKSELCDIIRRYKGFSQKDREKYNIFGSIGKKKKKLEDKYNNKNFDQKKKRKVGFVYSTWDEKLDQISEDELVTLCSRVDHKLQILSERIKLIEQEKNEKEAVQIHNDEEDNSPDRKTLDLLNHPSPQPLWFNGDCSYNQQVFSGSGIDLPGTYQNFGFYSENYGNYYMTESCNMNNYFFFGQPNDSQTLYEVFPIVMMPPLPFSDQSA